MARASQGRTPNTTRLPSTVGTASIAEALYESSTSRWGKNTDFTERRVFGALGAMSAAEVTSANTVPPAGSATGAKSFADFATESMKEARLRASSIMGFMACPRSRGTARRPRVLRVPRPAR